MKHCLSAILMAIFLVSCADKELNAPDMDNNPQSDVSTADDVLVSGQCRVLFSEEVTAALEASIESGAIQTKSTGIDQMFKEMGVTSAERLFPHAGEFEPRTRKEGLHRWYVLEYSEAVSYTKASGGLEGLPGVEFVEPVRKIKINDYAFNDTFYDQMWGLNNLNKPKYDINVIPVWENYTTGNPDVIVSVVDNGVEIKHEDLADNCLKSGHYNSVDGTSAIYPGDHGTHVAGTIAAVGNNGMGVVGIAGGDAKKGQKGVKILSCQIFKQLPDGSTANGNSAAAIKWGADHGAVISQNSWGYTFDSDGDGNVTGDELRRALAATASDSDVAAIDYFIKYAGCDNNGNQLPDSPMKGGVVIFAAGNDNIANGAPANYEPVIAVGSFASDGTKSSFSNYGPWVDIAAPGSEILSTVTGGGYASMNGTSMACPHVSGVAALVLSHHGGPGFTNEMLKEKLLKSANSTDFPSSYQIGPMIDAYGAMTYGTDAAPAKVTDLAVSSRANTLDLAWTVPADEEGKPAYGFLILYGKDKTKIEDATSANYKSVSFTTFTPDLAAGKKAEFSIKGLDFEAEYFVKVFAYSYGRNYSDPTEVHSVKTSANNLPVITNLYEGSYSIKSYEVLEVPFIISDPDGHVVEAEVTCAATHVFSPSLEADSYVFKVVGKEVAPGDYEAVFTATDEYGAKATYKMPFSVLDNEAPVIIKEIEDILLSAKGKEMSIDMTEYVTDPDGEQLKYDITVSNNKVVHVTPRADRLYVTALAYGLVDVEIAASDVRGEKVVFNFKVLVKDPSDPVSVYPNPVTDYVNVGTLDMAETVITITSSTGKVMHEETSQVSGIEPARIDMTGFAPGSYSVTVSFGGNEYKRTVVKL